MNIERVLASQRLPDIGESVVFYSENTGVHRGFFDHGIWRDIFDQQIERVTAWWPMNYASQITETHAV